MSYCKEEVKESSQIHKKIAFKESKKVVIQNDVMLLIYETD